MRLISIYVITITLSGKLGAKLPKQHLEQDIQAFVISDKIYKILFHPRKTNGTKIFSATI